VGGDGMRQVINDGLIRIDLEKANTHESSRYRLIMN
jgi:hypothetical protein